MVRTLSARSHYKPLTQPLTQENTDEQQGGGKPLSASTGATEETEAAPVSEEVIRKDIVQFSTQVFYADEADGSIVLGVMRLGRGKGRVKVNYHTVDGSAKAGDQYDAVSGELVFEDGEKDKKVEVIILDDDLWHATNEFKVVLTNPDGCTLGNYLHVARVKVLDQNTFPSDKYKEEVAAGKEGIQQASGAGLFWEFFKLNFQQPGMWWRTMLTVIFDQMHNINVLLQTWMSMYMVDVVFNKDSSPSELKFTSNRLAEVYALAFMNILPIALMHLWDSLRVKIDIGGHSEAFLRANIVRRYMNLTEDSRIQLDASRLQVAILDDTQKIAMGYCSVLDMVKSLGTVSVLTIFTLHSNKSALWIVVCMPVLMGAFVLIRDHFMISHDDTPEKQALISLLNEMLKNFKLITSYFQRPRINDMVTQKVHGLREKKIPIEQESKHDEYFPQWMGAMLTAIYIVISGPIVLGGGHKISLGTFLATISIIRDIAGAFSLLYSVYMKLSETFDPVREITWVFSLKTDLHSWKHVSRRRQQMTLEARAAMQKADNELERSHKANAEANMFPVDRLKLVFKKVRFHYSQGMPVIKDIHLEVSQGMIVALTGSHGSGKSTVLQILAHSLFPVSGDVFVPGHLRILMVDLDVLIFETWSALENLTFGVDQNNVDVEKVKAVLDDFAMHETWAMVCESLKKKSAENSDKKEEEKVDIESPAPRSSSKENRTTTTASRATVAAAAPSRFTVLTSRLTRATTRAMSTDSDSQEEDGGENTSPWHERLSQTEKSKICLARALIANPEVLILHKPFRNYLEISRQHMMESILKHVQNRGIGLPAETAKTRRPRTCFYSVVNDSDTYIADVVWRIDKRRIQVEREFSEFGNAAERLSRLSTAPGVVPQSRSEIDRLHIKPGGFAPAPRSNSIPSHVIPDGEAEEALEDRGEERSIAFEHPKASDERREDGSKAAASPQASRKNEARESTVDTEEDKIVKILSEGW